LNQESTLKGPRTVREGTGRGSKPTVKGKESLKGLGVTSAGSFSRRVNPKWAWFYRTLVTLRERLLQERRGRLGEAAQPLEPHSMDHADSATDEFDHNLALATLSTEQDALNEIDAALGRIRQGSYGVCEETGKPIAIARLKAIPWARSGREAAVRHETAGAVRPPHLGGLGSIRGAPTGNLQPAWPSDDGENEESPATDESLRKQRTELETENRLSSVKLKSKK
jgi:RNA polymerase-binding protein DksA